MEHRARPTSAASEESHLTYDEVSMQRSRNFTVALQELKNLRPQLYSAAEYFESSYHYSDQKQVVLENLKDYSIKALVNAVDHLGTVAYKLNDLLAQENNELSVIQTRSDSLSQRLRSCQEHSDREGMKQQSLIRTCPRNYSHYILKDPVAEERAQSPELFPQAFNPEQLRPVQPDQSYRGASGSKSLLWHLASDTTHPHPINSSVRTQSSFNQGSFVSSSSDLESASNASSPSAASRSKPSTQTAYASAAATSVASPARNAPTDFQSGPSASIDEPNPSSKRFLMGFLGRRSKQG